MAVANPYPAGETVTGPAMFFSRYRQHQCLLLPSKQAMKAANLPFLLK